MAEIFNFPARKQGRSLINDIMLQYWPASNPNKTIAYCTSKVNRTFEHIQKLYPHLILKKFDGYVSVKFPACEK